METKTKGAMEGEVGQAVVRFERDYPGRGPPEARAFLVDDLILVRMRSDLTPAEHRLAACAEAGRGRDLINQWSRCTIGHGVERLSG